MNMNTSLYANGVIGMSQEFGITQQKVRVGQVRLPPVGSLQPTRRLDADRPRYPTPRPPDDLPRHVRSGLRALGCAE